MLIVGVLLALVGFLTARMRHARAPGRPLPPPSTEPRPSPPPAAPTYTLLGLTGKVQGQSVKLGANGLTLGRAQDNDIPLPDELLVSRYHAEIAYEDGRFVLRDMESTNGTWVDGQRIARHALVPGNRIQIGTMEWIFGDSGGQPAAAGAVVLPNWQAQRSWPRLAAGRPCADRPHLFRRLLA